MPVCLCVCVCIPISHVLSCSFILIPQLLWDCFFMMRKKKTAQHKGLAIYALYVYIEEAILAMLRGKCVCNATLGFGSCARYVGCRAISISASKRIVYRETLRRCVARDAPLDLGCARARVCYVAPAISDPSITCIAARHEEKKFWRKKTETQSIADGSEWVDRDYYIYYLYQKQRCASLCLSSKGNTISMLLKFY